MFIQFLYDRLKWISLSDWLKTHGAISVNKDQGHLLCKAAALGDKKEIKRLLREGADVNTGDYDARTPIHLVAGKTSPPPPLIKYS